MQRIREVGFFWLGLGILGFAAVTPSFWALGIIGAVLWCIPMIAQWLGEDARPALWRSVVMGTLAGVLVLSGSSSFAVLVAPPMAILAHTLYTHEVARIRQKALSQPKESSVSA